MIFMQKTIVVADTLGQAFDFVKTQIDTNPVEKEFKLEDQGRIHTTQGIHYCFTSNIASNSLRGFRVDSIFILCDLPEEVERNLEASTSWKQGKNIIKLKDEVIKDE